MCAVDVVQLAIVLEQGAAVLVLESIVRLVVSPSAVASLLQRFTWKIFI